MDVSVIIVNYNTATLTRQCVDSLFSVHDDNLKFEVIIVDNASSDGSQELLENYPGVTFIEAGDNIGFGRANNIGARQASGRYLFF